KKARSERLVSDLRRLTDQQKARQDDQQWAALSQGFEFPQAGRDRWGDPVYSIVHDGHVIVDGSAELGLDDALELVRELVAHCTSPDQYRQHAADFVEAVAERHAEADAAIEAGHE
ncbi:MAG: hypothetical protein JSR78_06560, partial [Proteobacteria bacterium]|nr:hypothetical protein [Pseudomonadota bacterium]